MEQIPAQQISPICPQCHQSVLATAYFCSNCGKKLQEPPLSTSVAVQVKIFLLSIIMPWILFLGWSHWPAIKYVKSKDKKARDIGIIAIVIIITSTILTVWLSYVWTVSFIQTVNASLGGLGGYGL